MTSPAPAADFGADEADEEDVPPPPRHPSKQDLQFYDAKTARALLGVKADMEMRYDALAKTQQGTHGAILELTSKVEQHHDFLVGAVNELSKKHESLVSTLDGVMQAVQSIGRSSGDTAKEISTAQKEITSARGKIDSQSEIVDEHAIELQRIRHENEQLAAESREAKQAAEAAKETSKRAQKDAKEAKKKANIRIAAIGAVIFAVVEIAVRLFGPLPAAPSKQLPPAPQVQQK